MKSRISSSNRSKCQTGGKIIYPRAFSVVKHALAQTGGRWCIVLNNAIKTLLERKTRKFKHHLSCFNEKISTLKRWLQFHFCTGILQQSNYKRALGDYKANSHTAHETERSACSSLHGSGVRWRLPTWTHTMLLSAKILLGSCVTAAKYGLMHLIKVRYFCSFLSSDFKMAYASEFLQFLLSGNACVPSICLFFFFFTIYLSVYGRS